MAKVLAARLAKVERKNAPAELEELQVWSIPPNPHLLICHVPGDDGSDPTKLVSVQVRDNTLFVKKMRLRARRVAERRYSLEGQQPRWRGRW